MCGIVALVTPGASLDLSVLEAMRDRLQHRGPDGAGLWSSPTGTGVVGLAHRRLSIIDLSEAASQPMFSADRRLAIVFNGEIYNYIELREELRATGQVFSTRSDTEVLLAAYAKWGTDCLSRLNGMFAFALWDAAERRLFLARDRFGEKPLFLTRLPGGGIAFASEMKAFFAYPGIAPAPNMAMVRRYVAGQYHEEGAETLFAGIERIPAAHALLVDHSGTVVRRWRYWIPAVESAAGHYDEGEAVQRFCALLERSVRMRLRSDVPVGTSLSGGLDSSIVVCLVAGMRGGDPNIPQNTFSARFDDDPSISEGPQIDTVVSRAGVRAFAVAPDPRRLAEECRLLHWHQEEPFLSASIYLQWCVARLARENGTKVLLDGQGADELLAGYQYYFRAFQVDLADQLRLPALVRETRLFNERLRSAYRAYPQGRRRFDPDVALSVPAALRAALRSPRAWAGPYETGVPPPRRGGRLRRQLAEALQYNSLPALLRYADRNSMAFGRETRLPFLDHELVDWCLGLPQQALIKDGWQKFILRKAGQDLLPSDIQWRADKVGYAAPLEIWLRRDLRSWAEGRLFQGPVRDIDGYDENQLRHLWTRHQLGAENLSWSLWRWISLSEWLSMFAEKQWRGGV